MASEDPMNPLKPVDWKSIIGGGSTKPDAGQPVKKRGPTRIRPIPEHYFVPRWSWPATLGFFGACIAGGIGAGMLLEVVINKHVKEDHVVWEFGK